MRHGFDAYFGIPYSNDMDKVDGMTREKVMNPRIEYWNVPLMRGERVVERPADQTTITRRYTEEAVRFIRENRERPFFLYVPHTMPHVPLFTPSEFAGVSARGLYGDVIEEMDWSVGQIIEALEEEGVAERTLVVFTSDNGPWEMFDEQGGSSGILYGGKTTTWEGGMRVPGILRWPAKVKIPKLKVVHVPITVQESVADNARRGGGGSPGVPAGPGR